MTSEFLAPQGLARHVERSLNAIINIGNGPVVIRGEEFQFLASLDRFMRIVLSDDLAPFSKVLVPSLGRVLGRTQRSSELYQGRCPVESRPNTPAAYYLKLIRTCEYFLSSTELQYAPQLQLLMNAYLKHPFRHCTTGKAGATCGGGLLESDVFNGFVGLLRSMAVAQGLRKAMGNWDLNCREAQRNLERQLARLFVRHRTLSAIHLNLRLAKREPTGTGSCFSRDEGLRYDYELLRKCRQRFLDNLRRKPALFKNLVRYVWAVEWSQFSGYSWHITLLFDEHHIALFESYPEPFSNEVGRYWKRTTVQENGTYQLCHLSPERYGDEWVFGAVGAQDLRRREKLQRALSFLAMKHLLVRPRGLPPGAKLFQIGGSSG